MAIADILVNNHLLNNSGVDEQSGNDMTPSGAVYTTPGKLGTHDLFHDGLNDITTQDASTDLDETQPFALVCWFKPDTSQEANAHIMGIRVSTSNPADGAQGTGATYVRFNGANNNLQFVARNTLATLKLFTTVNDYKDDAWHLLIVGRDSSDQLRLNIDNGAEDITGDVLGGSWWENGDFFKIGAFSSGATRFKGYFTNVMTLDAYPDSSEVSEMWNGGAGKQFGVVAGIIARVAGIFGVGKLGLR